MGALRTDDRPLVHLVTPRWYGWGLNKVFAHRFPPMTLMVLAALAERHGWRTRIIDETYERIPADETPDLAAITVWTGWAPRAYELSETYRARGVPTILGGVHPSLLPSEALRYADSVLGGEAELILGTVLDDVLAGNLQRYYAGEWSGMEHTPMLPELGPIYERFPYGRYQPTHTVQSTRGCRFNCDFCSVIRINGRGSRHADVQRVVEDIRYRTTMKPKIPGYTFIFFLDDDMASDLEYAGELFEAIASANMHVRWTGQASIGLCRNPELLRLAAKSGCRSLFCGFESVTRDALVEANKKNRPSEYRELVDRAHTEGIAIEGSFIFGFDHDDRNVFDDTVEFLDDIGVDIANFSTLTPYPGTHTFARFHEEGRIFDYDWGHYNHYRPVVEPMKMTAAELQEGLCRAYRKFYLGSRQWRRFRRQLGRRDPTWSLLYGVINQTYGRVYTKPAKEDPDPQPAFTAHPDDLEKLLETSSAEAQLAISTAASLTPAATTASPITLGPTRSAPREQLVSTPS